LIKKTKLLYYLCVKRTWRRSSILLFISIIISFACLSMRHIFFLKRNHLFVLHSIQSLVHSNSKSPGTKRFRGVVVAIDAFRNRALIAYTTSQPNAHKAISVVNCSHFSHRFKQKQRCGSTEARAENIKV